MSLLFFDSFDHYSNGTILGKWNGGLGGISGPGRTGPQFGMFSFGPQTRNIPVPGDAFILGAAFQWQGSSQPIGGNPFVRFREGGNEHIQFGFAVGGFLTVSRSGTLIATATNQPMALNSWYYVEFRVLIHDTTGEIEVHVDGTTVTWNATVIGIDTRNAGTGILDNIAIDGNFNPPYTMVDDLYLIDDGGAAPRNTFLGPVKIEALIPQTDAVAAGSNAGLTPSTGTDHGALVDENPPNTSDYNSSATVGAKDTYNYPPMSLTGLILGIQTNLYVAKSDTGARQVCAVIRSGGADFDGANIAPLTSFQYFCEVRAQNPNGSVEWTSAAVNAMEAGMKVTV